MPVVADRDIGRKPMPWQVTPQVTEFLQGGTRCPQRVGSCGSAARFFPLKRNSCAWRRTSIALRSRRSTLIGGLASLLSNAATPQRRKRRKSRRDSTSIWRPWVASPFIRERGRVRDNLRLIEAVGAHPSPPAFALLRRGRQSPPLQQGERRDKPDGIQTLNQQTLPHRRSRITFVLPRQATRQAPGTFVRNSAYCQRKPKCRKREESASSPLGVFQSSTWPSSRRVNRDQGSRRKSEV
jgi:hypothetical protein